MHTEAFAFVASVVQQLPRRRFVVELGGRNVNGSVRQLFEGARYVSVDQVRGPGVDVVCDAADYRPEEPPDTVVCCEVLEHALGAQAIVANALSMLKPGGLLLVTCASDPRAPHSAIDGGALRPGEFYRNVPLPEMACWLEGTQVERIEWHGERGDLYALAVKR